MQIRFEDASDIGHNRLGFVGAVAGISCGTALAVIDGAIAIVALPTLARDLEIAPSQAVLVVAVYQMVLVMALLPMAALGDRLSHRRLYRGGQILFLMASLATLAVNSFGFLLALRALQAMGASAVQGVTAAMIRNLYPRSHLGRGLGLNTAIVAACGALAPGLGGIILTFADWRWLFAAAAPFALLSLVLGGLLPRPLPQSDRFDARGAILVALMLGAVMTVMKTLMAGWNRATNAVVLLLSPLIIGVALRHEMRSQRPIFPLDLLAMPAILLSIVAGFCAFAASMTLIASLPFVLEHQYGFVPRQVGLAMAAWPLAAMLVGPAAGAASDRIPAGLLGGVGMILGCVGILLTTHLHDHPTLGDVGWRMALTGAGFAMFLGTNVRSIVTSAPSDRVAAAGGLASTIRLFGQAVGALIVSILLAAAHPLNAGPLAAGLALLAAGLSLARLRK